ncbi:hypothetical protein GCM10007895_20070 [Paraferrimonas sedimenticola]|uniref:Uncharacterized protein n=1 Tax=Paraferrimonas sedimenticola TaxID=375674 RepID=A0AA37VXE9_9GAMM|nr:hypothetical protein GCM10007895_20070 [Paraferrimonas sedimenticola]
MLRSADLTLEQGFEYFAVSEKGTDVDTKTITTPQSSSTSPHIHGYGNHAHAISHTAYSGGSVSRIITETANIVVVMFEEKPADTMTYNAEIFFAT